MALAAAAVPGHAQEPGAPPAAQPGEGVVPAGFLVDTVLVRGNQRLTEEGVRGTAGIAAGFPVSALDVADAIRRLMATGQFEAVEVYARGAQAGRGALVLAETWIPSGMAALIITVSPFWMVGLNALLPPREPLHPPTLLGMAIGLAGAVLLVGPGALQGGAAGAAMLKGALILQLGCVSWSLGSLLQKRLPTRSHPIVSGGIQQLAAGLAFLPAALLWPGEIHFSPRGLGALVYLVIFGSIIGYSSYIVALERLPVAVVSIYNYINPVVAVALGWLFYREPFGLREAAAMLVIFTGVALVKRMQDSR